MTRLRNQLKGEREREREREKRKGERERKRDIEDGSERVTEISKNEIDLNIARLDLHVGDPVGVTPQSVKRHFFMVHLVILTCHFHHNFHWIHIWILHNSWEWNKLSSVIGQYRA